MHDKLGELSEDDLMYELSEEIETDIVLTYSKLFTRVDLQKPGEFFHEIAYSPDLLSVAKNIKVPLIIFRGESDEVMNPLKSDALFNLLGSKENSKFLITKSRNHFQNDSWDFIQKSTLDFFDSQISRQEVSLSRFYA